MESRTSSSKTVADCILFLKSPDASERVQAAADLAVLGSKAWKAMSALTASLDDPELNVRRLAVLALGEIGAAAAGAVPRLIELLNSTDNKNVRRRAAVALGEIGDTRAIAALRQALKDNDEGVRKMAAAALDDLRSPAKRAAA
jgi:HEAT repeat protein